MKINKELARNIDSLEEIEMKGNKVMVYKSLSILIPLFVFFLWCILGVKKGNSWRDKEFQQKLETLEWEKFELDYVENDEPKTEVFKKSISLKNQIVDYKKAYIEKMKNEKNWQEEARVRIIYSPWMKLWGV